MAYRLKTTTNFQKDVRRLLAAQIRRASARLSGQGENDGGSAVHETRKSLKRCRSILRLARPGLTKKVFQAEDHSFRAIAKILSQERDREVIAQTLVTLSAQPRPRSEREALANATAALTAINLNGVHHGDAESDARLALSMLKDADRAVRKIRVSPATIDTLAAGFGRTYAEARRALNAAYRSGDDEAFHAFRKLVQHHWRHLQLLAAAWPELMEVRVDSARELAQILGDDHDLSILAERLSDSSIMDLDQASREKVVTIARAEQARLRTQARPIARRLFAQRPRDMERMVLQLWPAAMQLSKHQRAAAKARANSTDGDTQVTAPRKGLKISGGEAA